MVNTTGKTDFGNVGHQDQEFINKINHEWTGKTNHYVLRTYTFL